MHALDSWDVLGASRVVEIFCTPLRDGWKARGSERGETLRRGGLQPAARSVHISSLHLSIHMSLRRRTR
jgi:hypothetical protein